MINPPMRSEREKVGGLYHFGRMPPEDYQPTFGHAPGLDGLRRLKY